MFCSIYFCTYSAPNVEHYSALQGKQHSPEKFKQHSHQKDSENYFSDKPKILIQVRKNIFNAAIHFIFAIVLLDISGSQR